MNFSSPSAADSRRNGTIRHKPGNSSRPWGPAVPRSCVRLNERNQKIKNNATSRVGSTKTIKTTIIRSRPGHSRKKPGKFRKHSWFVLKQKTRQMRTYDNFASKTGKNEDTCQNDPQMKKLTEAKMKENDQLTDLKNEVKQSKLHSPKDVMVKITIDPLLLKQTQPSCRTEKKPPNLTNK